MALDCYLEVTPTERHFGADFDPGEDFEGKDMEKDPDSQIASFIFF